MCDLTLNFIQLSSVPSVHLQMTCFEISADVTDQAIWVFKMLFSFSALVFEIETIKRKSPTPG